MANFDTVLHTVDAQCVERVKVTASADATYKFQLLRPARGMSIHAQGSSFGAGTVELKGSNDGTNFFSLPTAKTLAANGIASVAVIDVFLYYQIVLSGSTSPSLTISVEIYYNNHN